MSNHMLNVWVSRLVVFVFHAACLGLFLTGVSSVGLVVCLLSYVIRGFAITGGYHRLFAHNSYKTWRPVQALLGIIGVCAVQGGPLKWAREHRQHHKESDQEGDLHSPKAPNNFWWAHLGWILSSKPMVVTTSVKHLEKLPELVWIERLQLLIILAYATGMYFLGAWLGEDWGTSGWQMVLMGFALSTVITWHITWCVNSVTHTFGSRRFETSDDSRNNYLVGLLALGEGFHNNHHHRQNVCRQGLYWWEFDLTYWIIKAASYVGLTWAIVEPEPEVYVIVDRLEAIRAKLNERSLPQETIAARMIACQQAMASAAAGYIHLRKELTERLGKKLASMSDSLKKKWVEFSAGMQAAEEVALAS